MIKVSLQYAWHPAPEGGQALDAILFRVLRAIDATGSLAASARQLGMSYRHVWGLMRKWETLFGKPLAHLRRGRGAQLTEFGRQLLLAGQLVEARLTHELEDVRREIERALGGSSGGAQLALCASHDLALAELRDRLSQRPGLRLDMRLQGSLASLGELAGGRCTLAGFHLAEGMEPSEAQRFRQALKQDRHTLIGVATRTQGLMVARGNPKAIRSLVDLTRAGVRIVNRQRGSGSRVEFDQLLHGAGIDPSAIAGYADEEHTHLAVAALVAGGVADAGYGIKAAAAQYDLDFIALLTERYYLACRSAVLGDAQVAELLALLRGAEFRGILAALPGYGSAISGQLFSPDEALPAARRLAGSIRRATSPGV